MDTVKKKQQVIDKKINELYVSKRVTLMLPYRNRVREIEYFITGVSGNEMKMVATLKSTEYPCKIPKMHTIQIKLNNEFPNQK